jgi:holliday junction DNA helicase RuvA
VIASVEGRIAARQRDALVVSVGGIGLHILCPQPLLAAARVGEPVLLFTHLIVRDDELALVGFATEDELSLFEALLGVAGIGPKSALSILSAMPPDTLRLAIGQEQPEVIARAPGIGKKTAQKIVLELRDKVGMAETIEGLAALTEADTAVIDALTSLGYSVIEAQRAVQGLPREVTDVAERLRQALSSFGDGVDRGR